MASRDINVVALVKGSERYVFLYDDESRAETLQTLNRYAADPKLSFSWYDASVLGQKIRQNKSHSRRGALPHELIDARRNFIDKNPLNNDSKKFPCKNQDYGRSRSWTCF